MAYGVRVNRLPHPRTLGPAALISALGVLALIFATTPAQAAQTPVAVGSWSMVPQSKDANGDGFIDGDGGVPQTGALSLQPSTTFKGEGNYIAQPNERLIGGALSWYLNPEGFPVSLNACKSKGDSYTWTIQRGGTVVKTTRPIKLTKKTCRQSVTLPEGLHSLKLTVRGGPKIKRESMVANVSNTLMVVMGDSYASGEGNPRNVDAWLNNRSTYFSPYWDNDQCNRSTRGGPAQAALLLEKASAKNSVTLVNVSCSGATVNRGILGSQYSGLPSQVEQVAAIIGDSLIDVLSLTVGGNDVGFASVLTTCALNANCPLARATSGPLSSYPTIQDGIQAQTANLATAYQSINECFNGGNCQTPQGANIASLSLAPRGKVFLNSYPDLTRNANGSICSYLTITEADFDWARNTILNPSPPNPFAYTTTRNQVVDLSAASSSLNGQINSTINLGWQPVMGIWGASGDSTVGHGVCAGSQAWVFGLTGFSGFTSGSFHPNPQGQIEIGKGIKAQVKASGF